MPGARNLGLKLIRPTHTLAAENPHRGNSTPQRSSPRADTGVASSLRAVFVLAGNPSGPYGVMTQIALQSLRLTNPGMKTILICDAKTADDIFRPSHDLMSVADEILAIEAPYSSATVNSRYLKTKMRSIINGPFVFLDSDILVRGTLEGLADLEASFGGARNHSLEAFEAQVWDDDREILRIMNWDVSGFPYINTGVLYFTDTPAAYEFSDKWHFFWSQSSAATGKHQDQPAFNKVLRERKSRFSLLPDRYNAQFKMNAACIEDALVWHYYGSLGGSRSTYFERLVQRVSKGNLRVDQAAVAELLKNEYPWACETWMDRWVIERSMKRGRMKISEEAWLARRFARHLFEFLGSRFR